MIKEINKNGTSLKYKKNTWDHKPRYRISLEITINETMS